MPHSTTEQSSQDDQVLPDALSAVESDGPTSDDSSVDNTAKADEEISKETSKVSLEEMFATDDEDEEFPSSAPTSKANGTSDISSSPTRPMYVLSLTIAGGLR